MIRTCPKCGDYYADDLLAFCLLDGTPLVNVDPLSESWGEGSRVIEEKENALRNQVRKLKRRRVLLRAITMLMVIMIVCVVVVNGLIYLKYLKPESGEEVLAETLPAATVPNTLSVPVMPGKTTPTPRAWPTVAPKPTAVPITTETVRPTPSSTPSPTPTPIISSTPAPPVCSDADKNRERETIIKRFAVSWRQKIEGERPKIIAENRPDDAANPNAPFGFPNAETSLGAIEHQITFLKDCTVALVTAKYVWQVRKNLNGTIKVVTVPKEKRFACVKTGETWRCR